MSKWISVKDRLPENIKNVLVYNEDDQGCPRYEIDWYDAKRDMWAEAYCYGLTVTHWQPLPEPPKEAQ